MHICHFLSIGYWNPYPVWQKLQKFFYLLVKVSVSMIDITKKVILTVASLKKAHVLCNCLWLSWGNICKKFRLSYNCDPFDYEN